MRSSGMVSQGFRAAPKRARGARRPARIEPGRTPTGAGTGQVDRPRRILHDRRRPCRRSSTIAWSPGPGSILEPDVQDEAQQPQRASTSGTWRCRYESGEVNDASEGFSVRHPSRRRILQRLAGELGLAEDDLLVARAPTRETGRPIRRTASRIASGRASGWTASDPASDMVGLPRTHPGARAALRRARRRARRAAHVDREQRPPAARDRRGRAGRRRQDVAGRALPRGARRRTPPRGSLRVELLRRPARRGLPRSRAAITSPAKTRTRPRRRPPGRAPRTGSPARSATGPHLLVLDGTSRSSRARAAAGPRCWPPRRRRPAGASSPARRRGLGKTRSADHLAPGAHRSGGVGRIRPVDAAVASTRSPEAEGLELLRRWGLGGRARRARGRSSIAWAGTRSRWR